LKWQQKKYQTHRIDQQNQYQLPAGTKQTDQDEKNK
jgi:hypothetical protein